MSDVDITMPQLGETVSEGTVSRWLLEEGAWVEADEPVLEVSTDKVDTEVVAPVSGVLRRIVIGAGETVPVGTVLTTLEVQTPGGPSVVPDTDRTEENLASAQRTAAPSGTSPGPGTAAEAPTSLAAPTAAANVRRRHRDSPRVRRLAHDHGIDLETLRVTGQHGRASVEDVLAAATSRREAPAARPDPSRQAPGRATSSAPRTTRSGPRVRVERLSRRRRVIAERLHRSLQESAQLTTVIEVDLSHVVTAREAVKDGFRQRYGTPLSVLAFAAEAAVRALADHPVIHAELDLENGTVTYPSVVELGVAVDTEEGLVVPVIHNADDLTVGGIARRIAELAARARDGSATADDYAGGTFTITNTGSRGALFDTPILNAPQTAILALGAVVRRPVARRGEDGEELIAVRSMAYLSLTYDHRLVDGADASRYLARVKELLEEPARSWTDAVSVKEAVQ